MIKEETMNNNLDESGVMSFGKFYDIVVDSLNALKLNGVDPYKVPVLIKNEHNYSKYAVNSIGQLFGRKTQINLNFYEDDEIDFSPQDKRPEGGGEFWQSRGPSSFDVSGFVVSKEAGERIMRYVRAVLEKDKTETWLDWRKFEPKWIQLKFSADEFDCEMLDKLCRKNHDIITYEILRKCVKKV